MLSYVASSAPCASTRLSLLRRRTRFGLHFSRMIASWRARSRHCVRCGPPYGMMPSDRRRMKWVNVVIFGAAALASIRGVSHSVGALDDARHAHR